MYWLETRLKLFPFVLCACPLLLPVHDAACFNSNSLVIRACYVKFRYVFLSKITLVFPKKSYLMGAPSSKQGKGRISCPTLVYLLLCYFDVLK